MYSVIDDTIVAISSAPGCAARGLVRMSGPESVSIACGFFTRNDGSSITDYSGFTTHRGKVIFDDPLCEVETTLYLFREPRSYTRQDLVELHTVGSPAVLDMLVEKCLSAGARPAEPGEFTARAFLSGSMNLVEAEAVASTINARSDAQLRAARKMMRGDLAKTVMGWQDELAELTSLVVADIDFAEEPIDFISHSVLAERLVSLHGSLARIIDAAEKSRRFDVLPCVLLLGPPNVGKSTLLNTLSGMDRAIASAVSGTTRDILSAPVRLGRQEVVLLDAAGVNDEPDEVITLGRAKAIEIAGEVDLVCVVFDASLAVDPQQVRSMAGLAKTRTMVIATKVDQIDDGTMRKRCAVLEAADVGPVCPVSATSGQGIDSLKNAITEQLMSVGGLDDSAGSDDVGVVISSRQRMALAEAREALDHCLDILSTTDDILDVAEIVAMELREALDALGAISGTVTTEDLLGRIFASFCIGK